MKVSVLDEPQISRIHDGSMKILERTGVHIPHQETRRRLAARGARVDEGLERIFLPESLVADALATCGKSFSIYGRDGTKSASFGAGSRNYNTIAGEAHWVDEIGGPRRPAVLRDAATAARFADALEGINIVGAMTDPSDIPVPVRSIEVMATLLENTDKPVTFWFHDRASAVYINELCVAVRGSVDAAKERPLCYPLLEPISPLRFPHNGIDLLYETAKLNMPVQIGPMAQMGASAPMSISGTIALENAEILAGICVTQAISEGMPVCYGGICHAFDMSTTQMIFGGPEQAIFGVAMTEMGHHYGLPVYINVGLTDSKRPDGQAGWETGITLALGAAAGADVFGHMGICGVDQAASFDILVLQDEIIRYVESMMREVGTDDATMGIDVVEEVGPGGSFLPTEHTADHFRDELWFPQLTDRRYYEAWRKDDAIDTERRCASRREDILAHHHSPPLAEDLSRELRQIVDAARRGLG
jgi:trimethylamine---corrinoid protein Co-methyltransferase